MTADDQSGPQITPPRQAIELTEPECYTLLREASVGRIVFTRHAMPAIRPVNHLVDDGKIVIRTHHGAAIVAHAASTDGVVVCYEADDLDPVRHTGWSVIVTGLATLVDDPAAIDRYSTRLEPWVAGEMDYVLTIEPRFISGIRLVGWCA